MAQTCECGCRHGTSPSSAPVGKETRRPALMPEDTVAAAAVRTPFALLVLQRFGIDACCGGPLTLAQAAALAGIPVETLLLALEPAVAPPTT